MGDGRPLLSLTGVALFVSGLFAIFLATRREFLPHDIAFLGIGAEELCHHANCRIVAFMFQDRVAFGGTLISVAVLYLWLAAFPRRDGERCAWRAFAVSGAAGFVSFLASRLRLPRYVARRRHAGALADVSRGPHLVVAARREAAGLMVEAGAGGARDAPGREVDARPPCLVPL